jgi:hypothetical protein
MRSRAVAFFRLATACRAHAFGALGLPVDIADRGGSSSVLAAVVDT